MAREKDQDSFDFDGGETRIRTSSDMDAARLFASRERYRAAAETAGAKFKCLSDDKEVATAAISDAYARKKNGSTMEIYLTGPIDDWFGIDVREVMADIRKEEPKNLRLLIESPGGFLQDGIAFYEFLRGLVKEKSVGITAETRGLCASAAVLPYLAADTRKMTDGSNLMIHDAWTTMVFTGSATDIKSDFQKAIRGIETMNDTLTRILSKRVGAAEKTMAKWMREETWMDAATAFEHNFATEALEDEDADDAAKSAITDDEARERLGAFFFAAKARGVFSAQNAHTRGEH